MLAGKMRFFVIRPFLVLFDYRCGENMRLIVGL